MVRPVVQAGMDTGTAAAHAAPQGIAADLWHVLARQLDSRSKSLLADRLINTSDIRT